METDNVIKDMKHHYNLKKLYSNQKIFGYLAQKHQLWNKLKFITALLINFVVLFSFSQNNGSQDLQDSNILLKERMYDPRLNFIDTVSN